MIFQKRPYGLPIIVLLFLSGCANESISSGGLRVTMNNQWPPIKVVIPSSRVQKPTPTTKQVVVRPSQQSPVIPPAPAVFKPAPVRTIDRKPAAPLQKNNRRRVVLKKPVNVEKCRYISRDLSMPGSTVIYCMPSKAY